MVTNLGFYSAAIWFSSWSDFVWIWFCTQLQVVAWEKPCHGFGHGAKDVMGGKIGGMRVLMRKMHKRREKDRETERREAWNKAKGGGPAIGGSANPPAGIGEGHLPHARGLKQSLRKMRTSRGLKNSRWIHVPSSRKAGAKQGTQEKGKGPMTQRSKAERQRVRRGVSWAASAKGGYPRLPKVEEDEGTRTAPWGLEHSLASQGRSWLSSYSSRPWSESSSFLLTNNTLLSLLSGKGIDLQKSKLPLVRGFEGRLKP